MDICPELKLVKSFYDTEESERIFQRLSLGPWPDNRYQVAERRFVLPRLQTWHADPGIRYSYSNNLLQTRAWTPLLTEIRAKVEAFLNYRFNSVLVNCYRNGADYVGWHADNEPELGEQAFITSLTFGAERFFAFRQGKSGRCGQLSLPCGSLLIMLPGFQHEWRHSVPRDPAVTGERINLTFRKVITPPDGA